MSRRTSVKLDFQPLFAGSSANVLKLVELGKAVAGATLDSDLAVLPEVEASRFRTIMSTAPMPSHPLSAHPRVPPEARRALAEAVLALGGDAEGRDQLALVRLAAPVTADYARDYQPLEEIDAERLGAVQ